MSESETDNSATESDDNLSTINYSSYNNLFESLNNQRTFLKNTEPITTHNSTRINPIVIDSKNRNLFGEHLFQFMIKCTAEDTLNTTHQTPVGASLLEKIKDIKAIQCTSLVAPCYDFLYNPVYNGNVIQQYTTSEIYAELSIVPSIYSTNKYIRNAFNVFIPDVITGYNINTKHMKYQPLLNETRFSNPISYMHGMTWTLFVNHAERLSSVFQPYQSPDIVRILDIVYYNTNKTLVFTTINPIHPNILEIGTNISIHGVMFELFDSNYSETYPPNYESSVSFVMYLNTFFNDTEHIIVDVETDLDGYVIKFTIIITANNSITNNNILNYEGDLVINKKDNERHCVLVNDMQYKIYLVIEQVDHYLTNQINPSDIQKLDTYETNSVKNE